MKRLLFILSFIVISCHGKIENKTNIQDVNYNEFQKDSFSLKILSPYTYEFEGESGSLNRIDYFYLDGSFNYNTLFYKELKKSADQIHENIEKDYKVYSIYIYKKTKELNASYNKPREFFDGKNKDIIAYIRFTDTINDIFYIIKEGAIVYDKVENKLLNFEFDE